MATPGLRANSAVMPNPTNVVDANGLRMITLRIITVCSLWAPWPTERSTGSRGSEHGTGQARAAILGLGLERIGDGWTDP